MKPLLTLLLLALAPAAEPAAAPGDRWAWNARERTAAGARALAAGDAQGATAAFDVAQRLRPHDPRTLYNAGTARIGSDAAGAAVRLDAAARTAGDALAPDAWYNLGTARLAAGDARGAVAALTEALRRAPSRGDAKHNLELALAAVEEQQERQPGNGDSGGGDGADGKSQAASPGGDPSQPPSESPDKRSDTGSPDERSGAKQPTGQRPGANGESVAHDRALPQFHDLPDMTAEQAAAILRAVEDLERQQRRERAQRAAAARATVEIDW